jgi:hypothetical protein
VPLIRNHYASADCRRKQHTECQAGDQPLTWIHNEDHMLLRVLSDLTCGVARR